MKFHFNWVIFGFHVSFRGCRPGKCSIFWLIPRHPVIHPGVRYCRQVYFLRFFRVFEGPKSKYRTSAGVWMSRECLSNESKAQTGFVFINLLAIFELRQDLQEAYLQLSRVLPLCQARVSNGVCAYCLMCVFTLGFFRFPSQVPIIIYRIISSLTTSNWYEVGLDMCQEYSERSIEPFSRVKSSHEFIFNITVDM